MKESESFGIPIVMAKRDVKNLEKYGGKAEIK